MLNKLAIAAAVAATVTGAAFAQQTTTGVGPSTQMQTTLPQNATTVTNYYKQNVYDPSDSKIGEITDVLVNKDGKVDAFMTRSVDFWEWPKRMWPFPSTPSTPPKRMASGT